MGSSLGWNPTLVSLRGHYLLGFHPFHHLSLDVFTLSTSRTEKERLLKEVLLQLLASDGETKALRCVNLNSHSIPAPKRTIYLADAESAFFREGSFWK